MEIKDIFFPVTKLPVPPDEVDLIRIILLESIFKRDENEVIKEYRKVYFETSFEGKKISDGNNIIPSELIPFIFDARNNQEVIAYALTTFGFCLKHEIFEQKPDVFQNPYNVENNNNQNLNNLQSIQNENYQQQPTNQAIEQPSQQPTTTEPNGEPEIVTPSN